MDEVLTSAMSEDHSGTTKQFKPCMVRFIGLNMEPQYVKVGKIEHFYSKAEVAIVEVLAPVKKGDRILIRGSTTNIQQQVESMEVEHKQVVDAQSGQRIGLKVAGRVRENDIVYKVP